MESEYYICAHVNTCQYTETKRCAFGVPLSKNILDDLCGGYFNPQYTIFCDHPNVRIGVTLININRTCIEGDYCTIWTPF